jgi:8-oxo-dGTP pyrophosphatase MutT (NUDIX family)
VVTDAWSAAVAVVLCGPPDDVEVLLIERAAKDSDPWSGQMAFPGGKAEPVDTDSRATAIRETREEVGLALHRAQDLGQLLTIDGGRAVNKRFPVAAHVFGLDGVRPALEPNYEVADTVWMPLRHLTEPDRRIDFHYPPAERSFPGVRLDGDSPVLWGLTLRFLTDLAVRLDLPVPSLGS